MAASRQCSECATSLEGKMPTAVTCGRNCRDRRARRIKRTAKQRGQAGGYPPELQPLTDPAVAKDIAAEVMREELRPIVREALTEEVLEGVGALVGLTGRMVARLEADLDHPDPVIAQRAYTLGMKYTMGNPSVAPASAEAAPAPMQVVFNMPRPGDTDSPGLPAIESTALEDDESARTCVECHEIKPGESFVGNSERCTECHAGLQARVAERFGA